MKYGETVTFLETIKCGVPQSSILRPLLFLNFVNNPQYAIRLLNPIMIAYDKNLFYSHKQDLF